ncbi:hypothetical protein Q9295_10125 [Xinfangfangia sp. CPCC 101601]|uniref:Uncharacterized protein n=1 Tax=Pseudogemmobacter lacusdianii TaxID=3069608 RepID=A0ABU0VYE4_9RHOB|nr:hypothetical protein [Xinfangfangia sp. CPCC 101601]MDQ2066734.1 hypothetical protein [Xinfangfangia sp. CPCC 101601]
MSKPDFSIEAIDMKDVGDVAAGSAALGSYLAWLPETAALLAIIWTLIRIYEWGRVRIFGKEGKIL